MGDAEEDANFIRNGRLVHMGLRSCIVFSVHNRSRCPRVSDYSTDDLPNSLRHTAGCFPAALTVMTTVHSQKTSLSISGRFS